VTAEQSALVISAVGAYAAASALRIKLPDGNAASPAAAFAAAMAAIGTGGFAAVSTWLLVVASAISGPSVVFLVQRRARAAVVHLCATGLAFGTLVGIGVALQGLVHRQDVRVLIATSVATVAFFVLEIASTIGDDDRKASRSSISEVGKTAVPLAIVLSSTAGLLVMVFGRLNWLSFPVMFLPVLVTRFEFARYGETRRTYEQTVRTLAGLTEGAKYVRQGHQERVAQLCGALGRDLGLASERVRQLQLVALLHDVGTVSLPDPDDVKYVPPEEIARSTGRILEETGYLAEHADTVLAAATGGSGLSIEAQILRFANGFDELSGSTPDRFRAIRDSARPEEASVVAALGRVLRLPSRVT
jgi:hypothetical protein